MSVNKVRVKKTKKEALQEILNGYIEQHPGERPRMMTVAAWALETGQWMPQRKNLLQFCAEELSAAAREETYTDPQGREVRKKHVVRIDDGSGKQLYLWADIEDASPDHMRLSLSQRRGGILGDCKQLKTDMESFNENNAHGATLQMSFNFDVDLSEMDQPTDYPDAPPEE